jgi:cytochrome P450
MMQEFSRDRLGVMLQCARQYGDLVPLRLGMRDAYLISDPALIERVLVTDHRYFHKGRALKRSKPLFGNGLLTSEGDLWRSQRKLVQPAFHRERIAAYGQTMVDRTLRHSAGWLDGQTRDIHAEMMQVTLQIAVNTLFGAEIREAARIGELLHGVQEEFGRFVQYVILLPSWCPTPVTPRVAQAIRMLNALVYGLIRERRASGQDRGDLLSMLLRAQDETEGTPMSDRQVRDEVLTLFLAGHDTTALTMTWTLMLLSQNPEAEARLHEELDTVLAGRAPTVHDRARLKVTEQVIQEAIRLYPPAYLISRMAVQDYSLDGRRIASGATVLMSPWVVQRDARWFPDPERFDPERWAGDTAKALPRFAYFPFGGGPRVCIGNTFAMMESVLLLATLAQRYRFHLVPDQQIDLQAAVTLRPRHGLKMTICKRQSPVASIIREDEIA